MAILHKVEVHPFSTPNYVQLVRPPVSRVEALKEVPSLPLTELSAETLEALCTQFRLDVFFKANKKPA
jgi:hypothetical protein